MTPSLSVIIPLYNKRRYVARAVQSALRQSLRDYEVIVVDDGSTDGGAGELEQYLSDPRLRIVRQPNAGEGAARNRGLREMKSGLAVFLDADDAFLPHHLKALAALAARYPNAGLLGTAYYDVLPDGTRIARTIGGFGRCVMDDYFYSSRSQGFVLLNASSAGVRRSAVERIGGFLEGVSIGADLEFWARVALEFPVAYDARPSALYYRWTPASAMAAYEWRPDIPAVVEMLHRETTARVQAARSLCSAADYAAWILLKHAAMGMVGGKRRAARELLRHPVFQKSQLRARRALWWAATCAPSATLWIYLALRNWSARRSQTALRSAPAPALGQSGTTLAA